MSQLVEDFLKVAARLRDDCEALAPEPPVAYVYDPLVYAWGPYEQYLRRYARPRPEAVFFGMNPGPFGMLQTGVPFGDVGMVRDWLGIQGEVTAPARMHPKRPVEGFAIRRGEVSGRRVWGWAKTRFGTPAAFFRRFFVINYCPLGFFDANGANLTPDKFRGDYKSKLYAICDRALGETLDLLQPKLVMGIGRFAEQRAAAVAGERFRIASVTHPSPANPRAHAGWDKLVEAALAEQGVQV
jgi:single-strand selective monofunctional uracil DNA glycosylase